MKIQAFCEENGLKIGRLKMAFSLSNLPISKIDAKLKKNGDIYMLFLLLVFSLCPQPLHVKIIV